MFEPQLLLHFADELVALLRSRDTPCRELAYLLLCRLLKYAPELGPAVVPAYIHCLRSDDYLVAKDALRYAPVRVHSILTQPQR